MSSDSTCVLRAEGLTKVYRPPAGLRRLLMRSPITKPITAVDRVDLDVRRGEVFGLLGPNGAGKTTLMKLLTTLVRPTEGHASVCGHDVVEEEDQVRGLIGLTISEERSFYYRLSGRQNLEFFATLANVPRPEIASRVSTVLELMGLLGDADNMFYSYSSGMRQKLSIGRALLSEPEVLFLDEPTKNLDPLASADVRDLVKDRLGDSGRTVLLATHRMEEAEQLCDRLAIVRDGRIAFCGTVAELRDVVGGTEQCVLRLHGADMTRCTQIATGLGLADAALRRPSGNGVVELSYRRRSDGTELSALLGDLLDSGATVLSVDRRQRRLEEMFVDVVRG